jgi:hypothetical protein
LENVKKVPPSCKVKLRAPFYFCTNSPLRFAILVKLLEHPFEYINLGDKRDCMRKVPEDLRLQICDNLKANKIIKLLENCERVFFRRKDYKDKSEESIQKLYEQILDHVIDYKSRPVGCGQF